MLVAVTAMSDEESCRRITDAGFDLHLVKPVDPHKLVAIVDALWRAWESVGETTHRGADTVSRTQEPT